MSSKGEKAVRGGKPEWLKAPLPRGRNYLSLKGEVQRLGLHTVCQSALCPNIGDCWSRRYLTVMILGDVCTRKCRFCNVSTGKPDAVDPDEPKRVASMLAGLKLRHAVVTSVNRDDLSDGGAAIWAETIAEIRRASPETVIEALVGDFKGDEAAQKTVFDARPDIFGHNTETIERLYKSVRHHADFERSFEILRRAKEAGLKTKTGVMVGLGETFDEVKQTMRQFRQADVDIFTVGQYLQPSSLHLPVARFYTPQEFKSLERFGLEIGYKYVASGPLVRSSYMADEAARGI